MGRSYLRSCTAAISLTGFYHLVLVARSVFWRTFILEWPSHFLSWIAIPSNFPTLLIFLSLLLYFLIIITIIYYSITSYNYLAILSTYIQIIKGHWWAGALFSLNLVFLSRDFISLRRRILSYSFTYPHLWCWTNSYHYLAILLTYLQIIKGHWWAGALFSLNLVFLSHDFIPLRRWTLSYSFTYPHLCCWTILCIIIWTYTGLKLGFISILWTI